MADFSLLINLINKLSIKYQSYLKSGKIDAFEQKIYAIVRTLIITILGTAFLE